MPEHRSSSAPVVRFAPSPTGRLHIGNARTALFNWMFAKSRGGTFILRYDDTDSARSTREFADGITEDLSWLGIHPDRVARQSARIAAYDAAVLRLRAAGRLYPCYESEEELDYRRKRQLAMHRPPVYDRAALKLTPEDIAKLEAEGRRPHWRFLLDHRAVVWDDRVRGSQSIDCASLSDPVLVREDGTYLYTLPSVVDDIEMGVSDIIRGEDHVTNSAVQIQLFELLGSGAPHFAHHNLLTLPSGEGLSKRLGHLSLKALREDGFEPMAVAALAVLTGTSHSVVPVSSLDELAKLVDVADVSHSAARFDPAELESLNPRVLHQMDFAVAAPRLAALDIPGDEAFWLAVRGNLVRFGDARLWWDVVHGDEVYRVDDGERALVRAALDALPGEPWSEDTWKTWTSAVSQTTGTKGRALFHPLRMALTGREQGPELKLLLPLIGHARVVRRLEAAL